MPGPCIMLHRCRAVVGEVRAVHKLEVAQLESQVDAMVLAG
jgi:hypothetical protein